MTMEFTVDDGDSTICFCGLKICCCGCMGADSDTSILRELRLDQQQDLIRQLDARRSVQKKRMRRGIFQKKLSITSCDKDDKKTSSTMYTYTHSQHLIETKKMFRRSPALIAPKKAQDVQNDITIVFSPHQLPHDTSSCEITHFKVSQEDQYQFEGSNQSKIMFQMFLESNLFESVIPCKQKSTFQDKFLPEILWLVSQMVSYSVVFDRTSLYLGQKAYEDLVKCVDQAIKVGECLVSAIEEISMYLHSLRQLTCRFDQQRFVQGDWVPNWHRLHIFLPKFPIKPTNRTISQCQQAMLHSNNTLLRVRQLTSQQATKNSYIITRNTLVQVVNSFQGICVDLYMTVRKNRPPLIYQQAYKLFKDNTCATVTSNQAKQMIKERQLFLVRLEYLRQTHDQIWSGNLAYKIRAKVTTDVRQLKSRYYNKA